MRRSVYITAIAVGLFLAIGGTASGAGFEVAEQGGKLLGNAYAGKAAIADDATTVFFNPAGMTRLSGHHLVLAGHAILPRTEFNDDGSTAFGGGPARGGDGGDPGEIKWIPAIFAVLSLSEELKLGFGTNAPYGLKTDYRSGWKGRYQALESELQTVNLNGSLAAKVHEMVSVGVGFNVNRADATLENAVDFGTIGAGSAGPAAPALGLVPEGLDGVATVEGADSGFGWNAGVLVEAFPGTRVGLSYRSKVPLELRGDGTFEVPAGNTIVTGPGTTLNARQALQSSGAFVSSDVTARLELPEQIYLSVYHEIDETWTVLADVTWTNWSRFDELRVVFDNPAQPDAVTEQKWEDALRYSVGGVYKYNEKWTFRAGLAFDESPIPDEHRTARIPTNDRIWVAIGASYQLDENISVHASWAHIFIEDAEIEETAGTGQMLKGEFEPHAEVFGMQVNISF